jgi:signal transduction histidine kinase/DNA-binding response OmpR family regulator/HPt (histidine-containing phosphotransfer) domain-containing protein
MQQDQKSPGPLAPKTSVRAKLLKSSMWIWVLINLATIGGVCAAQYRASSEVARRVEQRIRTNQRQKGKLLVANQTLALRTMASDNAFSDVQNLVRRTVHEDTDLVYGVFATADNLPWILVTPTTPEPGLTGVDAVNRLNQIPTEAGRTPAPGPRTRTVVAFGAKIEEHAADVFDGADYLGTIRYGINLTRTERTVAQELDRARKALLEMLAVVGLLGIAGMLMGTAAMRRVAHRITQPLADLTQAAAQLGQGHFDSRASVSSGDELEQLARTFNAMADANQHTMLELEARTAEALEASRLKSEFLANMSHEIRTPMNGILGIVELIRRMPLESKLKRYIETIDVSAAALLGIINDVLDFSKMEAGKYTLRRIEFNLQTVVEEVCELLAIRAHDKGIVLVSQLDPKLRMLYWGDPDRWRQVINNLLGNAIKFTDCGEIAVSVRIVRSEGDGDALRLSVRDTGIGISESDAARLFEAFSQVDGSSVRRFGGTGLGLAISKRLVEMMGGAIGVNSRLGEGSEFYCDVQLEAASDAITAGPPWSLGKHALLAESHAQWQRTVGEHLEAWGMKVTYSGSGSEALACVEHSESHPFDIAVIDSQTANAPFQEFLDQLRSFAHARALPVVALYRLGSGSLQMVRENQLIAQLPKPLRMSELYNSLQAVFSSETLPAAENCLSGKLRVACSNPVLVVDDNDINRLVAAEMLEQMGYVVETAVNGAEAIEMVRNRRYFVVLMDCQMPIMDGYTATREIRKMEQSTNQHTVIIALTAHALFGERDKVLEAGMDDYLSKPVRPSTLDKTFGRFAATQLENDGRMKVERVVSIRPKALDATIKRSKKLIAMFLKNLPEQLNSIHSALVAQNAGELRQHAHKTKGSCLAVGALLMADTAAKLQALAETGTLVGGEQLAALLQGQYQDVELEMRCELCDV